MKPRKDSADKGAGSGCMARLVRCSSFLGKCADFGSKRFNLLLHLPNSIRQIGETVVKVVVYERCRRGVSLHKLDRFLKAFDCYCGSWCVHNSVYVIKWSPLPMSGEMAVCL